MMKVRYANITDLDFWLSLDKHISNDELIKKINNNECLVILNNNEQVGILRYNLFWDNIPFVNMLYIKEEYQRKGFGKTLMLYFEELMKSMRYTEVMTSTLENENGKYLYYSLGYKKTGSLFMDDEPEELILIKKFST